MARLTPILVLGAVASCGGELHAQNVDDLLDPTTHASPSGEVTLFVDPSQPSGAGPARYRCMRGKELIWSGERPYTLWDAVVSDDGLVAGYAYAAGLRGGADDALTIVLLAPDGTSRVEERSRRGRRRSCLGPVPNTVVDLFFDTDNDRLVVRKCAWEGAETWLSYALSTGAPGPSWDSMSEIGDRRMRSVEDARPIPGTGLVLICRSWMDFEADRYGAAFQLVDREGHGIWRLDWPDDHRIDGDSQAKYRRAEELQALGSLQCIDRERFTLRRFATSESVSFGITRLTGPGQGWEVREIRREPLETASAEESRPEAEARQLELEELGRIQLGTPPIQGTIHDVLGLALDGRGRPGMIRRSDQRFDFVRVDAEGENAVEIPLPEPPDGEWWGYAFAWTSGERWILIASGLGESPKHAWWLDASARTLTPLEDFEGPSIESLAGTPDGGFVLLGTTHYDSRHLTQELVAFGPDGHEAFRLGGDQGQLDDPASLFSPVSVAVLLDGEIVVLSRIRNTLQFFSAQGEFLRTVDLEQAWGRAPKYLMSVRRDWDGGLLVHDLDAAPVKVDGDGKIVAGFEPRSEDGSPLDDDLLVGSDGSPWSTDIDAVFVRDRRGVVQRVLGAAPDPTQLLRINGLALGPHDRIHARDWRTGAIHVFGPDGSLEHVCVPAPGDETTGFIVTNSGDIVCGGGVRFAADGTRLESGVDEWPRGGLEARRGSDGFWVVDHPTVSLVDADGAVLRTIEHTPDGKWLRVVNAITVAGGGAMALATTGVLGQGEPGIHIYEPNGDPVRSLKAPAGIGDWTMLAFDGTHLAIPLQVQDEPGSVLLIDATGKELGRFTPDADVDAWQPFFARQGRELWLFDLERTLRRFALP